MGKPPNERVQDFMAKYGVNADEVWEVRTGSGNYAIKHSALERIAADQKINFDTPLMLEFHANEKIAVICVTGKLGERSEWSIGEAAPYNNKNAYPFAMAEKRAKDRVILKLLNTHGTVYSEEEADDLKRENQHVNKPTDFVPDYEVDEQGHPVDNIPYGDEGIEALPKAKSRAEYTELQKEMRAIRDEPRLKAWGIAARNRVATMHPEFQAMFRGQFREHRDELRAAIREVA
jgi:hypothetical protein